MKISVHIKVIISNYINLNFINNKLMEKLKINHKNDQNFSKKKDDCEKLDDKHDSIL